MTLHYVLYIYSTAYLNSCSCYGMRSVTSQINEYDDDDVTNHLSSHFGTFLQNYRIYFKEHGDIGTTVAAQTYMLAYCFKLRHEKIASDIQKFPENISNSKFSRINKFPEISMFTRVVSTVCYYCYYMSLVDK